MIIQDMVAKGLITPPTWLPNNTIYLCIGGSHAYGTNRPDSDFDIRGITIPPKHMIFPHLEGHIHGFGTPPAKFEQWDGEKHVIYKDKEYDFDVKSIIKFFELARKSNPETLEMLFMEPNCVMHSTKIFEEHIKPNRHMFLSRRCFYTFKGYAMSQLHKMYKAGREGNRHKIVAKHGYDVKFASNVVRLLDFAEQILSTGELDLQANREHIKAVKRGDFTPEEIKEYAKEKEKSLEKLHDESPLPKTPPENRLRGILMDCLESHYGSLSDAISTPERGKTALREIQSVMQKYSDFINSP